MVKSKPLLSSYYYLEHLKPSNSAIKIHKIIFNFVQLWRKNVKSLKKKKDKINKENKERKKMYGN